MSLLFRIHQPANSRVYLCPVFQRLPEAFGKLHEHNSDIVGNLQAMLITNSWTPTLSALCSNVSGLRPFTSKRSPDGA